MVSAKMVSRCVVVGVTTLIFMCSAVYLVCFNKPPPEVTLQTNKQKRALESSRDLVEKDVNKMTPMEFSRAKWNAWVDVNGLVSIGEVYDGCGE